MNTLSFILVGAVAGWMASTLTKGKSSGLILNIILGIVGAYIGNWLFTVLGVQLDMGYIWQVLFQAFVGAVVVLFIARSLIGTGRR